MKIDRKKLVSRHNPVLTGMEIESPLTVGNGEFCFTADITGLQTLYREYASRSMPLCTMSQWGWHTTPVSDARYAYEQGELEQTSYPYCGSLVSYPVECKPGNEEVYHWLRQNPHRLNLARVGLLLDGKEITVEQITGIHQELELYQGILYSDFLLDGCTCHVETAVAPSRGATTGDCLGIRVESELLEQGRLSLLLAFPYGSPDISASDWSRPQSHSTSVRQWRTPQRAQVDRTAEASETSGSWYHLSRTLERERYELDLEAEQAVALREWRADQNKEVEAQADLGGEHLHFWECILQETGSELEAVLQFCPGKPMPDEQESSVEDESAKPERSIEGIFEECIQWYANFWETTGVISFEGSTDERAKELERRLVLSEYLLAIQSSGSLPPQETGLTCNSWYGKFHLEMYFWHEAWLPLWGRSDLLERSLSWFWKHLPQARENAAKNHFLGARWPKMVGPDGIDSPSPIAPLLIWQQPHIIAVLQLAARAQEKTSGTAAKEAFERKHYLLVKETADFMADFPVKNEEGYYELLPPLIPVQECHPPMQTRNPVFEVEYWVWGLRAAIQWAEMLGEPVPDEWREVAGHMLPIEVGEDGCYQAHSNCQETFSSFAIDHPSMLMAYGVIDTGRMNPQAMEATLRRVLECWDETSLWGWDFAVMAMTAVRLGRPELAVELLLRNTVKNVYVTSGNNRQVSREDLPLYLPGNGSLLLAAAMMTAGYEGCQEELPGIPKDGSWKAAFEGILPLP